MAYNPQNPNWQATMANSSPVVLASNQSAIPITDNSGSLTVDNAWTFAVQSAQSGSWNVWVNNASWASAVNIQDWGNSITVDWAVTANIGTTNGIALDATLTGWTTKAIVRWGAKGTTTASDVTSTAEWANNQALDVQIYHGGTAKDPTQIRSLASWTDSVTTVPSGTQIVSGTVSLWTWVNTIGAISNTAFTANAWTNLNTSALALETWGNLATVKTNTDNLNLAIGSTTTGQKGNLAMWATTTAAPTYTTWQSNPLSLTTTWALRVDNSWVTQPISGNLTTVSTVTNLSQLWGTAISMNTGVRDAWTQRVTIATNDVVPVTDNAGSLTVDAPVGTPVFVRLSDGATAISTLPVSIAATVTTKETRSATPSQTSPSVTTASTSILASNANRLGATIYNDAGSTCFVKLGATASATSYSVQVAVGGYYEVPFQYTWAIDGIVSSGTATLRVTELT